MKAKVKAWIEAGFPKGYYSDYKIITEDELNRVCAELNKEYGRAVVTWEAGEFVPAFEAYQLRLSL